VLNASERAALAQRVSLALRGGPFRIDEAALPDDILVAELPVAGRSVKIDKVAVRALAVRAMAAPTMRVTTAAR
jgi:hypothetical protein